LALPFCDGCFDSALCTEVLEHVPSPERALRELRRVLKCGGQLLITAPMTWGLHYEPFDYFRYTRYGLEQLVIDAGFEVLAVERVGGVFSLIGARLADVVLMQAEHRLSPLPARVRLGLGLCGALPISVAFYGLGRALDGIDPADALGWVVLARKSREPADRPPDSRGALLPWTPGADLAKG
jgi:SAM-dependent methyltransferase